MKIDRVEVIPIQIPVGVPPTNRRAVAVGLTRVYTSAGIEGYGYASGPPEQIRSLVATIQVLGEALLGEEPGEPERLWQKLAPAGMWSGRGGNPIVTHAASALDMAVWDLLGKMSGQPLYRLLGGYRSHVPVYASTRLGRNLPLADLPRLAAAMVEEGFRAIKMNVAGQPSLQAEIDRVRAVREAIGPDVLLMADANSLWTPAEAIRVGRRLEEFNLYWLEDPVPAHNIPGLAEVGRALEVPIATGETLLGATAFRPLLEARAVDIPMIDLMGVGGITPFRKVVATAELFGMPVVNHLQHEVCAHLIAAAANGLIVEYAPRTSALFHGLPALVDGGLVLSDRPGLGLELDWDFINSYRSE